MDRKVSIFALLVLGSTCAFAGPIDIGSITLQGSQQGYQIVGAFNYTGATQGCGNLVSQYNVCNALNISSWALTIDYIPQIAGLGNGIGNASTLSFTSNGVADSIAPTDAAFDAYKGEASNPWSLPFDITNSACQTTCDAYVTSIIFSGTVDQTFLQLGNAGSATSTANVPGTFTTTLTVPNSDYVAAQSTDGIIESTDIILDTQSTSSTPEPATTGLFLIGATALGWMKRRISSRS